MVGKRSKRPARLNREPWGQCPSCRVMVRLDLESGMIRFHKGCEYRGVPMERYTGSFPEIPRVEMREFK